jgi:hypothetical protein
MRGFIPKRRIPIQALEPATHRETPSSRPTEPSRTTIPTDLLPATQCRCQHDFFSQRISYAYVSYVGGHAWAKALEAVAADIADGAVMIPADAGKIS